jgi:hypothetical protein
LKRLFLHAGPREIEAVVRGKPTGAYARRIWFLYEWLLGARLDLPDAEKGSYAGVVDAERQWTVEKVSSPRHRLWNNLPGTPAFCPLVFRTEILDRFVRRDLEQRAAAFSAGDAPSAKPDAAPLLR